MSIVAIVVIVLLCFVVAGVIGYLITVYNGLIRVTQNINKSWANIDVILKQRHDEIPKLIKVCEGYTQYERSTLEKIINLRAQAITAASVGQKAMIEGALSKSLTGIFAVGEAYPELKSNVNFMQLQNRISGLESQIADRRELYNESVNIYNIRIKMIPDVFLAGFMNLQPREMFKVSEEDKKDVDISFNLPK